MDKPINLTTDAVIELLSHDVSAPAVTIYVPTHLTVSSPNMSEDQIRCKNMIHKAVSLLKSRDDGRELANLLNLWLSNMMDDRDFWEDQTEGLLICAHKDVFALYHLPIETEEYVAVGDHFHLAPMLGFLRDMKEYYVLVVAQHEPALFRGDAYEINPSGINLPASLNEGLNLDEIHQKAEQQRSAGARNGGSGGFNGRGGDKDPAEDDRMRFWRLLDQIVCYKVDTRLPIILAGTGSELSEYRSVSHHPNILDGHVNISFGDSKPHNMFMSAIAIVRHELVLPSKIAAIEEYSRARGRVPDHAASGEQAIKQAAETGRVDKLLLDTKYTTDESLDKAERTPIVSFPPHDSAETLQDIAYLVWNNGGTIINIDADIMPERGAFMLATLRY